MFLVVSACMLLPVCSSAPVVVADSAALRQALSAAKPGSVILIKPGTYSGGNSFTDLKGTLSDPITIAGEDPANPPIFRGGNMSWHLRDPAHVVLRDLVIEKTRDGGINIDDAGSFETPATGITLERITVREVGPEGNRDGIKLSGVDHFKVIDCDLQRWGSGGSGIDMVGCHHGEIVGCTFSHLDGNLANGVQAKGGTSDIVIRDCRFENAGTRSINVGGSTGMPYFRPKPDGFEARNITVEDCYFIGSDSPIAFVGVDGAIVRHNTIYRPRRWIFRILQETKAAGFVPCRNGIIERNIVVFDSQLRTTVNVGDGTAPETFIFRDNLWHCTDRPQQTRQLVRLPTQEQKGVYDEVPKFVDVDSGDLKLAPGSPGLNYGVR